MIRRIGKQDHFQPSAIIAQSTTEWSEGLVKAIAMDIGKEVVAYVEVMYPKAIVNSGFKLSLRNCVYNEIMAAIKVNDAGQIEARLKDRKAFRRWWVDAYRKIRSTK
jgi:hypothetical protein